MAYITLEHQRQIKHLLALSAQQARAQKEQAKKEALLNSAIGAGVTGLGTVGGMVLGSAFLPSIAMLYLSTSLGWLIGGAISAAIVLQNQEEQNV